MLESIWTAFINKIAVDLVTVIVSVLLVLYAMIKTRVFSWIKNEMIRKAAEEGFALVEQRFKDAYKEDKFDRAYAYTSEKLTRWKIKVPQNEIEAAIEKAVVDYNAQKAGGKIAS
ncbi:phage holin, LLH family [Paenibacillus sp. FSL R5-0486]|uniref:phage holin, LLH family n=1 Tax=Paenibacillus sp. FSL R5-0486 TaxID=2921645 RepID=UPI0030DAD1BC